MKTLRAIDCHVSYPWSEPVSPEHEAGTRACARTRTHTREWVSEALVSLVPAALGPATFPFSLQFGCSTHPWVPGAERCQFRLNWVWVRFFPLRTEGVTERVKDLRMVWPCDPGWGVRTGNHSGGWGRKRSSRAAGGGGEPLRAEALGRMTGGGDNTAL